MSHKGSPFHELLRQLGEEIGIPDLQPDEDGECALVFDEKATVILRVFEEDFLLLECQVGNYTEENELAVFRDLAGANFLWVGTGGATLAANTQTREVHLFRREAFALLDTRGLAEVMRQFVEAATFWCERLPQIAPEASKPASTAPSQPLPPSTGIPRFA